MLAILHYKVVFLPQYHSFTEWKHTIIIIANIMSSRIYHLLTFDLFYNKSLIQYFLSLDREVVLANFGITGSKKIQFLGLFSKVYLSKIGIDVSERLS